MSADEIEGEGDTLTVEQPGGYDQLPTAVWMGGSKEGAATPGEVVAYLAVRRFGTMFLGRAIPRREELADDMGVSVGTLDDRLNGLIKRGWLLITPRIRKDGQGQSSNHYQLLWEPIVSEDDARLVEHRRRVAEFEAWMDERMAARAESDRPEGKRQRSVRSAQWEPETTARRSAYWQKRKEREDRRRSRGGAESYAGVPEGVVAGQRGAQNPTRGGAENPAGGAQDSARAGAQNPAPLEPHVVELHNNEPTATAAAAAPTGKVTATVVDAEPDPGQPVDLFGEVDTTDLDAEHRRTVHTLVKAYVDTVTGRGGHCTASIIASIGSNVRRIVRNDGIPPEVLLVAVRAAAVKGLRSVDGILAAPDGPQASWNRPAARRAMQEGWIEMGRKLDAAHAQASGGGAW